MRAWVVQNAPTILPDRLNCPRLAAQWRRGGSAMAEIDETDEAEEAMTADQLREFCTRPYGAGRGQTALSRELRVNDRTVRRWASGRARLPHPGALRGKLMVFLDEQIGRANV